MDKELLDALNSKDLRISMAGGETETTVIFDGGRWMKTTTDDPLIWTDPLFQQLKIAWGSRNISVEFQRRFHDVVGEFIRKYDMPREF